MDKNIIIYIILVAVSLCIFNIIIKRKCNLLKKKQAELKEKKETNNCLISMFYQILRNK